MAVSQREQALSLLAAANNHGDLAVKLSSLKQAKDIFLSADLALLAAELFPYLVELQSSHEALVRKTLVEAIEEISLKTMEYSPVLMQVLLTLLSDDDSVVARQSIVAGTHIFCKVLEELALQFHRHGLVERWLEDIWSWMIKLKDTVFQIALEARSVGPRLLAIKFLETCVLLFMPDNDSRGHNTEATRSAQVFNVSWLAGGHPVLDSVALQSEANRSFLILLDLLRSASVLPGSITISVVSSLATIARRRQVQYSSVLSALLDFDASFIAKGAHNASIQYSLRTAFLGFLRCTHPVIMESREKLLKVLRAMNAGDAADQVMRQVDKMLRNSERASRDARANKDEQPSSHVLMSGDMPRKRSIPMDHEHLGSTDLASKRIRYGSNSNTGPVIQSDSGHDHSVNGASGRVPPLDNGLTPVEQMIAMIGALLAEGERGAESLEILISQIHPDLLADIVVTNMKHLPKSPPPLTRLGSLPVTQQSGLPTTSSQVAPTTQNPVLIAPVSISSNAISTPLSTTATSISLQADPKRDSRRDPRRLDPRRVALPVGNPSEHTMEDVTSLTQSGPVELEFDASALFKRQPPRIVVPSIENTSEILMPKAETELHIPENITKVSQANQSSLKEQVPDEQAIQVGPEVEFNIVSDVAVSPIDYVNKESDAQKSMDTVMTDEDHTLSLVEADQLSPSTVDTPVLEEASADLPVVPSYVELTEEQQSDIRKLAIKRIIDSYKQIKGTELMQTRMALLSRLVAQVDADDDVILMIQKHIVSDYQHQKGHELVMHVLYHLHALRMSDSAEESSVAVVYEKFLLGVARCLLDALPASDKSFSRLFSEAPSLPESAFKLLDDICCSDNNCGKDIRDGDRVTQGLGSLWSLILGRPHYRQAFLDIALKCAVHPKDDIRSKAIRLVANKLYVINFISEKIEDFATSKLLSAVNRPISDTEVSVSGADDQRTEGQMGSQETSISGSQISEPGTSENGTAMGAQSDSRSDSSMSPAQAQQHLSLFFALCTKKASLLQLVFDRYDHAPKSVKQAIHRHVPILIRALGPSYSDLLCIISDPPQGSENLLTQVLHVLCEGTTPSADLITTVKRLYETKLKDATILIPILSSFTKNEVLPIFPRLVHLPLDKFQTALAHILQGSAHMGPALTPAEVLVAIHDISPEKDGVPLKKIMDACSACFAQRTVFTQQVLAKALNQMVDQTPLPLLFMRTVIQAIDAFPKLVDFVMEILSKLVSKQVWRMPKLWVGFLKCISETRPHSFHVLLQLPSPQLEGALNKYGSLRVPLAAYANQPNIKASLPRSTLQSLGLASEPHLQQQQQNPAASFNNPDKSTKVEGTS
ncbi:symplekin isoform X2 [Cynara cardunculus var. scolymus]|uniref:symplekin isoform X2 n=1 Tax=Cynara cardunculus var. scolymus TaxID=59895 RepID=UPI000D627EFF|nr:symplekin isoform X2 [Cynara cardunculus var. scolymus]